MSQIQTSERTSGRAGEAPRAVLEAFLAGREERQLFARDRRLPPAAPLVYLEHGAAEELRGACHDGHLVCPLPECVEPRYTTVGGSSGRRHHFKHATRGATGHARERYFHIAGKDVLAAWARTQHPDAVVTVEQPVETGQIADVLVRFPDGSRVALELQYSAIDPREWDRRTERYRAGGVTPLWVFGHIPPHRLAVPHADLENVRITTLLAHVLECNAGPVVFLNPQTQQFARLLSPDDVRVLHHLPDVDEDAWPWVYGDIGALTVAPVARYRLRVDRIDTDWEDRIADATARYEAHLAREAAREAARRAGAARRAVQNEARNAERRRRQQHADEAREAANAAAAQRLVEARTRGRRRITEQAAALRSTTVRQNVTRLNTPASSSSPTRFPENEWRLVAYATLLHGRVGEDLWYENLVRKAHEVLRVEGHEPYTESALLRLLDHLRSRRFVDFVAWGSDIVGPIKVLADLDALPGNDTRQPRRRRRAEPTEAGWTVYDVQEHVVFHLDRDGRVLRQCPTTLLEMLGPEAENLDSDPRSWMQRRHDQERGHPPSWVTDELPTDTGVHGAAPEIWHAAIWRAHIVGAAGRTLPWAQLMATVALYNDGGRGPDAQRALRGLIDQLAHHDRVAIVDRPGDGPSTRVL